MTMNSKSPTSHNQNFKIINQKQPIENSRYQQSQQRWEQVTTSLELTPVPLHVDIELTNNCDVRCVMCERKFMRRKFGMMSMALFKRIVDDCENSGVESVKLNLWGESLLHKKLLDMVQYAKENSSLILQFNTNANRLTGEISRGLVTAGLDKLAISVDGVSEETYRKVRKGGSLKRVTDNIEALLDIKKASTSVLPVVTLQIIAMTETKHEIDTFVETWQDKVDCVSVTNVFTTDKSHNEIGKLSLRRESPKKLKPCPQLWQRLSILWDGTVTVCCNDYDGELSIGTIQKNSVAELWNCAKLKQFRRLHRDLEFSDLLCKKCENIIAYK